MAVNKKAIGIGVSIILVVGVCIGVIASVSKTHGKGAPDGGGGDDNAAALSSASKQVAAICVYTDHAEKCVDSMSSVAGNESATPIDYLKAAINYTITHVKHAAYSTAVLQNQTTGGKNNNNKNNMTQELAFKYCGELLDLSVDELTNSLAFLGTAEQTADVVEMEQEIRNWLSAVRAYHGTCVDGFEGTGDLHKGVSDGLLNSTQLTSNALAIFASVSSILANFNLTAAYDGLIDGAKSRRRLSLRRRILQEEEGTPRGGRGGFPHWLSTQDRKLLQAGPPKPDAVVAQDGSGQFRTITAALAAYPKGPLNGGRYVIYVKAGIYDEYITITKNQPNIFMYGDGTRKTVVTGNKSNKGGFPTWGTASFAVIGNGFICRDMGFQNTAGAIGHQAVALRVQSDRSVFYNCRMDGYQDTLYQQAHYQFYRNCEISGTVDFIFGDASAIIQNSKIIVRKPMPGQASTVTAQGKTDKNENCAILPDTLLAPVTAQFPSYLGRPWKQYSTTVIMQTAIGGFINPAGWMPWAGSLYLDTLFYAEFGNTGPGANTAQRVKWKGFRVLTADQANQYTVGPFLLANQWLPNTGLPFSTGMGP
ncbi:unnamed protein product [Linum tenue]|uniref:Pectinesterase n=1 Tax=Linum tenue TaxID=586396 RepID=A0AAV0PAN6_9ROSI|nr:unnamed protein product [Linum tenue]